MKKFLLFFFIGVLFWVKPVSASSATAVAESQVEATGDVQAYQSVETTVNGQTVKKESTQPGRLELEMKSEGGASPTVTFSQETAVDNSSDSSLQSTPNPSPTPTQSEDSGDKVVDKSSTGVLETVQNFLREIFGKFLGIFKI